MDISFDTISGNLASNSAPTGSLTPLHMGAAPASSSLHVDGDTVSISDSAKALASSLTSSSAAATSTMDKARQNVAMSISELQTQLSEAQSDPSLTQDQRTQRVQELQTELLMLLNQQMQLGSGGVHVGGTPAVGFGDSVSSFST